MRLKFGLCNCPQSSINSIVLRVRHWHSLFSIISSFKFAAILISSSVLARHTLLQFLVKRWLVGIAIVYDFCGGYFKLTIHFL